MGRCTAPPAALPDKFIPRFWDDLDQRTALAREVRQRYETLRADTGADSAQKDMLVRRAVFIGLQLETMEANASRGNIDVGVYTQSVNALSGLLTKLGLERKAAETPNLRRYVEAVAR